MIASAESMYAPYAQRHARELIAGERGEPTPYRPVAVRLRGVEKSFGAMQVLRGIDLDIPSGQFVAIVERSGCGKSTLLRLLAGLDTPSVGRIGIGSGCGTTAGMAPDDNTPGKAAPGEATSAQQTRLEHVRLMFQEPRLLPWARVGRNVEVGLTSAVSATARPRLARETLARVGLAERADDWPAVLSGGQKQRVALARALVSRPWLLALDEPLGALDALTRIGMQALIEDVWRAQGFTAVLVTHDVAEAVTLADRVLVLEDGRITADITIDLARPRRHGDADVARMEGRILDHLLQSHRLQERSA
jgi:sulfonate transport system ATP-binding protein